jgi:hypothetical protein
MENNYKVKKEDLSNMVKFSKEYVKEILIKQEKDTTDGKH